MIIDTMPIVAYAFPVSVLGIRQILAALRGAAARVKNLKGSRCKG